MHDHGSARSAECLSREVLRAYHLGKLPAASLESVANHLTTCPDCDVALQVFWAEDDSLIRNLRRYVATGSGSEGAAAASVRELTTVTEPLRPGGRPEPDPLPRPFGRYELLQRIGRGGMGVVYKARQAGLNRLVALKMTFGGLPGDDEGHARFHTEGEAIARLQHPNIVQVHECGEHDGRPYFSMELIAGGNLAQKLADKPLPQREAAALVATLARAVQYAHEQGVIHRDLKPSNVLLGPDGEVKLSDFGLAKLLDPDGAQTWTEGIFGTPCYMAPEQAEGKGNVSGTLLDVYGLGAILYETLTGQPPFRGPDRGAILELVRTQPPLPPSRLCPKLSRVLEAICLKCLAKTPAERYPSAEALAEDLERWLRGEATVARPPRWHERLGHALRRHPVAASVAALCGVGAVVAALVAFYRQPDRPLWLIEQELAQGRRVVLIGETGGPRWSRWRAQSDPGQAPVPRGDHFSMQSWGVTLLELVRDPQSESYRFSAEVLHQDSQIAGWVGLYVVHQEILTPHGEMHEFIHLSFNDIIEPIPPPLLTPRAPAPPRPRANLVRLSSQVLVPGQQKALWEFGILETSNRLFVPSGRGRTGWRKLVVEVTPQEVRGLWHDGQLVGTLLFQKIAIEAEERFSSTRAREPGHPFVNFARPDYPPRGGLGLYLDRGSAAFRSVSVEPF